MPKMYLDQIAELTHLPVDRIRKLWNDGKNRAQRQKSTPGSQLFFRQAAEHMYLRLLNDPDVHVSKHAELRDACSRWAMQAEVNHRITRMRRQGVVSERLYRKLVSR